MSEVEEAAAPVRADSDVPGGEPSLPPAESPWQRDARLVAGYLGAGVLAGIAGGFVIGGIGSRIAMLVLRLTTGSSVVGIKSDDGFEIGRLSADTFFLLFFGSALGAAVGVIYLLSRPWIPARLRTSSFGVLGALVGGSAILHESGIDFRRLEPVWLAVLMFIALPAFGAVGIASLAERFLRRAEDREGTGAPAWVVFLPLLGLLILGPAGLVMAVVVPLGFLVSRKLPVVELWTSPVVTWIGRGLLTVWATAGAVALTNDLRGILG